MRKLNGFKVARNVDLRNSKYGSGSKVLRRDEAHKSVTTTGPGARGSGERRKKSESCSENSRKENSRELRILRQSTASVKSRDSGIRGGIRSESGESSRILLRDSESRKNNVSGKNPGGATISDMALHYTGTSPIYVSDSSEDELGNTLDNVCRDSRGRRWSDSDADADSSATYPADTGSSPEIRNSPSETRTNSFDYDDCELFKKIIEEAPLISTIREPMIDNEYSSSVATIEDRVDSLHDQQRQELQSRSNVSSVSRSVSKTESSVSISTFDLEIPWLDPVLLEEGKDFVRRNFVSVMFAHVIGLVFLLCVKPISAILLRYGRFHKRGKRNHWHQYLLLLRRLKFWYEARRCDLRDPDDQVTADILKVRKGLCKAGRNFRKYVPPPAQELELTTPEESLLFALREDLKPVEPNQLDTRNLPKILKTIKPDVPWSQYDLAVVQFAFFGLVVTYPGLFGIWNKRGLRGFVHMWAVFGHLLGLQPQFNLAAPANFDEKTNERIFKDVFLFSLRNSDCSMFRMTQLLCDGVKWWTICMTRMKLVLLFMVRDMARVESTKNLSSHLKWYEKFEYWVYTVWLKWIGRIFFMRIIVNLIGRLVLAEAYALYLAQMKWKNWRAKRKPRQLVLFPLESLSQIDGGGTSGPNIKA